MKNQLNFFRRLWLYIVAIVLVFNLPFPELSVASVNQGQFNISSALPQDLNSVANRAAPSVVSISAYQEVPIYKFTFYGRRNRPVARQVGTELQAVSTGTAFFVTPNGYLLTNRHVVSEPGAEYKVKIDGALELPAKVVYLDPLTDLALVKIEGQNYPVLTLAEDFSLKTGDGTVSIGNALGIITDSVALGQVTNLLQTIEAQSEEGELESLEGLIETDSQIFPGDSGGPLLNQSGEVVGINVATSLGVALSYAIPSSQARRVLQNSGVVY